MKYREFSEYSILIILLLPSFTVAKCVITGLCHPHTPNAVAPCVVNQDPVPFNSSSPVYERFTKYCADLALKESAVCCTPPQADHFLKQLTSAESILGRCPSCFDNFAKLWCEFTCSPHQHLFVEPAAVKPIDPAVSYLREMPEASEYVESATYRISDRFAKDMFNSCKDVTFSGRQAISMMCNTNPCTIESWLKFIGTKNIAMNIPINTNFEIVPLDNSSNIQNAPYMDVKCTPCNQPVKPGGLACARMECNKEEYENIIDLDDGKLSVELCQIRGLDCNKVFVLMTTFGCLAMIFCVAVFYTTDKDYEAIQRPASGRIKRTGIWIQKAIEENVKLLGIRAAQNPSSFFLSGTLILFSLGGMVYHKENNNVADMWSSPHSRARIEETVFNNYFGKVKRYEQVMFLAKNGYTKENGLTGPIFDAKTFEEFFDLINQIRAITAYDRNNRTITLDDVCYRPMGPGYDCLIMSPLNYLQGKKSNMLLKQSIVVEDESEDDFDYEDTVQTDNVWNRHIDECIKTPMSQRTSFNLSCFGTYGGPSNPNLVFGRKPGDKLFQSANSIIATFLVTQNTEAEVERAELWELEFLKFCHSYTAPSNVLFSYMSERSIQDEIENDASNEIVTITIALAFLIGYVTFSLGRYFVCDNKLWSILVHSRILLGSSSVIINILSSFCAWGLYSAFGIHPIKNALIVQFFMVTVIGVSRTFLLVKYYAQKRVEASVYLGPKHLDQIIGSVTEVTMPGVIASSFSCAFAFLTGSFAPIPAIRSFCLLSGLAVMIDLFLHCTIFMALFVWDTKRELEGRAEICVYLKLDDPEDAYLVGREKNTDTYSSQLFRSTFAPFLMKKIVRVFVMIVCLASFAFSIFMSSHIEVGLDQTMAFSEDSYVTYHMHHLDNYVDAGPQVFFVVDGEIDWHEHTVQNRFCSLPGCDDDSFGNILNYATSNTELTGLTGENYNWIDNYLQWISRDSPCCKVFVDEPNVFCSTNRNQTLNDKDCRPCMDFDYEANLYPKGSVKYSRPSPTMFYRHLKDFLEDTPNSVCVFGGKAQMKNAISFTSKGTVQASHFMTFLRKLSISNSSDFIWTMERSRMVARRLERAIGHKAKVFAHSKVFPFYEQYSSILQLLFSQVLCSLTGIFSIGVLTMALDFKGILCVAICQVSNFFHVLALSHLLDIQMNAMSGSNLIVATGIFTEFGLNVVKCYHTADFPSAVERAQYTVANIVPIIFSGPVVTMAIATMFLATSNLRIITVYFFKMIMIIILSSGLHSLVILPVLLSFGGSRSHRKTNYVSHGRTTPCDVESKLLSNTAESQLATYQNEEDPTNVLEQRLQAFLETNVDKESSTSEHSPPKAAVESLSSSGENSPTTKNV
ncbi:unnamed protein product [Caenorhabditis bovis]|uniref:SSD domain-containing protein n=1 Tax=Caenorhabditis bovis TaxID=2654633 RepID=A0A8S1EDH2_9PELO|nr:unnamed protein product [Caenorhabditis bovis]